MQWDVFISHASEDKQSVARPLARLLRGAGLRVWLDENVLTIGDSLSRKIDHGLANSRFGVVILSKNFFAKDWPAQELAGLVARQMGGRKVILPVWHGIVRKEILRYSPTLADAIAARTELGLESVREEILRAIETPNSSFQPDQNPARKSVDLSRISRVTIIRSDSAKLVLRLFLQGRELAIAPGGTIEFDLSPGTHEFGLSGYSMQMRKSDSLFDTKKKKRKNDLVFNTSTNLDWDYKYAGTIKDSFKPGRYTIRCEDRIPPSLLGKLFSSERLALVIESYEPWVE